MSDGIKELVKRLRAVRCGPVHVEAADALEALAGEVEKVAKERDDLDANGIHTCHDKCTKHFCVMRRRMQAAEAERDRLQLANARMKAALEEIADITQYLGVPTLNKIDDAFQRGLIAGHETCAHIARKALGGDA